LESEAADTSGLAALLQPLSLQQFFGEYWERKPLHQSRAREQFYQHLIQTADLEKLIGDPNSRYPAIQLARGGHYLAPETYTHDLRFGGAIFGGVPDVQKLASEYRNGASVVLPALQRLWPPLGALCRRIEAEISHAVHANAYLTAGNSPGFTPHYDTHEVLVLQIAGRKRWSLYPSPIRLPHRTQRFDPAGYQPSAPIQQIELSAGDLLYLPRGSIHSAATYSSFSVHVTVGISVYTWADLSRELLEACPRDEQLRRALPIGFATPTQCRDELQRGLREALDRLGAPGDPEQLAETFVQRVRSRISCASEVFRADVTAIDASTQLLVPAAGLYRIREEAGHTVLEFESRRHLLPAAVAATLRALTSHSSFRTSDLSDALSSEARLGLSRYLLEIGFLKLRQ
jgi:ribosomal protein L16 Arg81 hydroxylase